MTEEEICNLALSKIGTRSTIVNFAENSAEAVQCRLHYVPTRDQILRMAHWNWAKRFVRLAVWKSAPGTPTFVPPSWPPGAVQQWTSAYPPPPWLYSYTYPSDCVQMRYVVPNVETGYPGIPLFSTNLMTYPKIPLPAVRYEIAGDFDEWGQPMTVINTNQFQAVAAYTYRVVNTSLYDDLFVEALAAAMAAKMSNSLTGVRTLKQDLFAEANMAIINARARDGNEGLEVIEAEAAWIAARSDMVSPVAGYWMTPYPPLFGTT